MKWKDDAPYVLCLTHDVDRVKKQWYHYCYYGIKHPAKQCRSLMGKIAGKEPYWNFDRLVSLEEQYGVTSTFLFLNETARKLSVDFIGRYRLRDRKVTAVIKKLDQKGFDIGLHGSFYSYYDETMMKKEKELLEEITGHPVYSTRQHHLKFDERSTWRIQKKAGLKYDSTDGYADRINERQPFRTKEGMIEIPLTMMDTMHLDESAFARCASIAEDQGVIMVNFHQCHFNELEYPQNVEMYERLLAKAKKDNAWITNMKELGDWLNERL